MKTTFINQNDVLNIKSHREKSIGILYPYRTFALHMRYLCATLVLLVVLGVGNAWAGGSYYTGFKATGGASGKGYVYSSTSSTATPAYDTEVVGESKSDNQGENGTSTYYAWAKPVRGNVFNGWTLSNTTKTTDNSGQGDVFSVTASSKNGTVIGTVTAQWTTYTKVNVTYNKSDDGEYTVAYSYNSYNSTEKTITAGDAEGLGCTINSESGNKTIGSYYNDVITLTSTKGDFQGWYKASDTNNASNLLSTDNPYTYVAPQSDPGAVYPKYAQVDKYYGRLTASIAAVPYSMPAGGMIFISKETAATPTYSDAAQTLDNVGMGTTSLTYYLKAQPTDKRYVFRGWYSNAQCTGTPISTNKEYTYSFTASSTNSSSPTEGNVYAAFDFNLYYMEVQAQPATPGLGMVLVSDTKLTSPEYTQYSSESSQFAYAYRLAPTTDVYVYAKPKYGYKLSGWYSDAACTQAVTVASDGKYTASSTASTDPMNPDIITLYAKFVPATDGDKISLTYKIPDKTKGEYTASVLDITEVDDEYVWTFTEVYNSVDYTADKAISQHKTDVLRLEAACKAGYGVTSWTDAGTAKTTPSHLYETTGTATGKTYGVAFDDAKPFLASTNSTQYATLREALTAVGSSGKITVVQKAYVEPGDYTIPSGVSLIVPYESTGKTYTSPSSTYEKNQAFSSASQYVLLTLGSGVNITIAGSLYVMADLCSANGGGAGCGAPATAYGRIAMSNNSTITINNGANLYCWGFITGTEGLVTVKNGGKVHEPLQHQNNPGGTKALAWNEKAFFMNQYYVQNVESPLKIEYGAVNQVYALMYIQGYQHANAALISKDNAGMFALTSSSSYLIRTYNPATDRTTYDIYGNAKLNYISMSVYIDIDTRNYVLPITSNLSVKCHTLNGAASTFSVPYAVSFLPGAELVVDEGVTVNISNKLIIYDRDEWIDKGFAEFNLYSGGTNWSRSSFTPTRTYTRTKADLVDAKVDLNGTMSVSGSLYTTTHGAAIVSSNGTGTIQLSAAAPGNSNDIQYASNNLGTSTNVPITPAQLLNPDGSYVATAGSASGDKFIYSKNLDKWMKNPKTVTWNANGGTTEATTMAYSQDAFIGELPAAYKEGHTFAGWWTAADGGTQIAATTKVTANATYYAHWTPITYDITYMDQGKAAFSGTHIDTPNPHPTTYTAGTATTLNGATSNKVGYDFGGWHTISNCKASSLVTSLAADGYSKNINLYAKWVPQTYNLTYEGLNGASNSNPATYTIETETFALANPGAREGYTFTGWMCGGEAITQIVLGSTGDKTITANWNVNSYTLTWTTDGDALTGAYTSGSTAYGTTIVAPNTPTKTGYTFAAWTPAVAATMPAENTEYTATWNAVTYNLTYTGLEGASNTNPATYTIETETFALADPGTREGYTFSGWTCGGSAITQITAGSTGDKTITANWNVNSYTLTWTTDGDALTGGYTSGSIKYGAAITVPATPTKTGYTFAGWSDGSAVVTPATNMPAAATTYTATWTPNTNTAYTVKHFKQQLDGTYAATPDDTDDLTGTTATEVTPAVKSYTGFTAPATQTVTILADGSRVVEYQYTRNSYTLTWTTDGDALMGDYTHGSILYEAAITAPATPTKTGYTFAAWTPAVAATMPAAATEYTATWNANTNTAYTVKHYKQQLDGIYADTPDDTDDMTGTTATATAAAAKTYTGFTAQAFSQGTIAADGSTVVEIYYTRNRYTITLQGDGCTFTGAGEYAYNPAADAVTLVATERPGNTFDHWSWTDAEGEHTSGNATLQVAVTGDMTYTAHTVSAGIVAEVEAEAVMVEVPTSVPSLIIQATDTTSGEIIGGDNITSPETVNAYFDWSINLRRRWWYAVAVPWQVDAATGISIKGGRRLVLGRDFDLLYYREAVRAANGKNKSAWRYVEDDPAAEQIMQPGRAYMIAFGFQLGETTLRFTKKDGTPIVFDGTISVSRTGEDENNSGWNGIANPALYKAYLNAGVTTGQVLIDGDMDGGVRYGTILLNDAAEGRLPVGRPVYIQRTATSAASVAINRTGYEAAPVRRRAAAQATEQYELRLNAVGNTYADRLFFSADEKENRYIAGKDLARMGVSTKHAGMWIDAYDSRLCVHTAAWNDDAARMNLTLYAPAAGDYTLSLRDAVRDGVTVYLTYMGEAIANLSEGMTTVSLTKGSNTAYGIRLVRTAPGTVTNIDEAQTGGETVRKVVCNGHLYILREGSVYNAQGQTLQTK